MSERKSLKAVASNTEAEWTSYRLVWYWEGSQISQVLCFTDHNRTLLFHWTDCGHKTSAGVHRHFNNLEKNAALLWFLEVSPELWQHVRVSSSCHWCTRPLLSWCQWPLEPPRSPPRLDRSAWQFPVREPSSDQITYWLMIQDTEHRWKQANTHSKSGELALRERSIPGATGGIWGCAGPALGGKNPEGGSASDWPDDPWRTWPGFCSSCSLSGLPQSWRAAKRTWSVISKSIKWVRMNTSTYLG